MKVTARIPATAKVASKPGVVVVVVDLLVVVGSVAGVELVVVVVDFVASEPGVVLVVATVVDFVSSATLRAISIIVAISMAINIFFISKPRSVVNSNSQILNSKLCKL
jgi:hypothetical protein